jgi:hypothetical protein
MPVPLGHPVQLVPPVLSARPGRPDRWGLSELLGQRGRLGRKERRGHQDLPPNNPTPPAVRSVQPVLKAPEAPRATLDLPRPPGAGAALRVISNQEKPTCDAGELMISAYCPDEGGTLHINGTMVQTHNLCRA